MSNGALFMLVLALVLKEDAHIRIDVLSKKLPPKLAGAIETVVFLVILAPSFAMLSSVAVEHTRSEEHTSELQSLMRISYAVFCLKKKNNNTTPKHESAIIHTEQSDTKATQKT